MLIASTFNLSAADAFHESHLSAEVRAGAACSGTPEERQSDGVKAFNEEIEVESNGMKARASQLTTISGSGSLTVNTSGSSRVEASEDTGGCGTAGGDLFISPIDDDDEFDGQYFFQVSGSLSIDGDSDSDQFPLHSGCINYTVGTTSDKRCLSDGPDTVTISEGGLAEDPDLSVINVVNLNSVAGFAVIEWDLTFTMTPNLCSSGGNEDSVGGGLGMRASSSAPPADPDDADSEECSPPTVTISDPGATGPPEPENVGVVLFSVTLSGPSSSQVALNFETRESLDGFEAKVGQDFEHTQGQLTFDPGATERTIAVRVINDQVAEPDEGFEVVLELASGQADLEKDSGLAIVRDNDCGFNVPNHLEENNVLVPSGTSGTVCGSIFRDVIRGLPQRDVILGGAGDDVIIGRGGPDEIAGGGGEDFLYGGFGTSNSSFGGPGADPSADHLVGGPGSDAIDGEGGGDLIEGGAGDDQLSGGAGDDIIYASSQSALAGWAAYTSEVTNDDLFGEAGEDELYGSDGNNLLDGGPDGDEIYGHRGIDTLLGKGGNDTLSDWLGSSADLVPDTLDGGNGPIDFCHATALDQKIGCEFGI